MKKKLLISSILLSSMVFTSIANASVNEPKEWNGWWNNGEHWEYYSNNQKVTNATELWGGNLYYLDEQGYLRNGFFTQNGSILYCKDGRTLKGWAYINNSWYYFDSNGIMLHDTTTPDGYYVGSDGAWTK